MTALVRSGALGSGGLERNERYLEWLYRVTPLPGRWERRADLISALNQLRAQMAPRTGQPF